MGDGVHTIEQLVDEVNHDPRRGIGHEKVLTRLVFDHQAESLLAKKGYTRETVPADGEQVFLRSTGNLSTGGTATDMTDRGAPRQRRDGGARGEGDRARRGRRGLPHDRHHRVVQGGRRRDLRGQRGARLPHAHGAERGTRARRRRDR